MWVDRRFVEALLADRNELHECRGAKAALEQQVASQKTQIDSLITLLNLSNTDRSLLIQRVLDVGIPVATFERGEDVQDRASVSPAGLPDRSMPMPADIPGLDALGDLFADVGDEKARREGLTHAPTGEMANAGTRD